MTTLAQLRKAALALPEVEEGKHGGATTFEVRGARFASARPDGFVQLSLSEADSGRVLATVEDARAAEADGASVGAAFPLNAVNGMELNSLVRKAWMNRAPEPLVEAMRAALRGEAPAGPDALPKSIGRPATRGLLAAGINTLPEVAARSEKELLALHGVGPRAIRLLAEVMVERGLAFKPDEG